MIEPSLVNICIQDVNKVDEMLKHFTQIATQRQIIISKVMFSGNRVASFAKNINLNVIDLK